MRGFYKALESFDPYPSIFAAFGHWVCEKVEFELLNLSALYNRGKVRDAFIRFVEKFGHHPTIKELAKFAKLNPHLIANVIHEVVEELGLCPKNNLLFKSLLDLMGMDPASAPPEQSARVERVDKVLKQMRPSDACLIVLKHTCECSEQEILSMIKELRKVCFRRRDADAVCACLDAFTKRHGFDIKLPWDVDLLEIKSRGRLAVRLCRARVRFAELLSHSS